MEAIASRMALAVRHRGPDDSGVWVDAQAGIALGHRRLSILDLSPAGRQPMVSACGRYAIAFNGEIYNHLDLRAGLEEAGGTPLAWHGRSDTETLLAAFSHWGVEEALRRASGMFAIALWDRKERVLTLARDRMGEKPLYYGWQGDIFMFGSELRALRVHPAFQGVVDRGALALLLRFNHVPAPYSIYAGVRKLSAGTFVQLRLGQRALTPAAYWSWTEVAEHGAENPFVGTDQDAVNGLERCLGAAVRSQMIADVPLGALLSGGIDSSLIAALMNANCPRPVRTFTVGFDENGYNEAIHARVVATHLGTEHTEIRLTGSDARKLVPHLPSIYDEPFADSSQLPTNLVMKLARQHVTVALSGDGGDELFGGYNRYVWGPRVWGCFGWMPGPVRRTFGAGLSACPTSAIDRLAGLLTSRQGVALLGDKIHKIAQRLGSVRSMDDLYVALVSEWGRSGDIVVGGDARSGLLDEKGRWPKLSDPVARMMALDGLTYLPDDILTKVDRAAMAESLETRMPFLDRDVIEFAWTLPMNMKIRNGKTKWLLRRMLDKYVPSALLDRPKTGFAVPLDAWLRGPLREWAESLLAEGRLEREGYFHSKPVRAAWRAHLDGRASYGHRLWSVLMFQAWLADLK